MENTNSTLLLFPFDVFYITVYLFLYFVSINKLLQL